MEQAYTAPRLQSQQHDGTTVEEPYHFLYQTTRAGLYFLSTLPPRVLLCHLGSSSSKVPWQPRSSATKGRALRNPRLLSGYQRHTPAEGPTLATAQGPISHVQKDLSLMYRIVTGKVVVPVDDILLPADSRTRSNTSTNTDTLFQPVSNIDIHFFYKLSLSGTCYLRPVSKLIPQKLLTPRCAQPPRAHTLPPSTWYSSRRTVDYQSWSWSWSWPLDDWNRIWWLYRSTLEE